MINYILDNKDNLAEAVISLVALLVILARFTPSEKDDGFLAKLDYLINHLFDLLKLPNVKKKDKDDKPL